MRGIDFCQTWIPVLQFLIPKFIAKHEVKMTDNHTNVSPAEARLRYGLRQRTGLKAGNWQETLGKAGSTVAGAAQNVARTAGQTLSKAGSAGWNALPDWATWPW
jgi:hypothetical protein